MDLTKIFKMKKPLIGTSHQEKIIEDELEITASPKEKFTRAVYHLENLAYIYKASPGEYTWNTMMHGIIKLQKLSEEMDK